jgi:hypothetical protein
MIEVECDACVVIQALDDLIHVRALGGQTLKLAPAPRFEVGHLSRQRTLWTSGLFRNVIRPHRATNLRSIAGERCRSTDLRKHIRSVSLWVDPSLCEDLGDLALVLAADFGSVDFPTSLRPTIHKHRSEAIAREELSRRRVET